VLHWYWSDWYELILWQNQQIQHMNDKLTKVALLATMALAFEGRAVRAALDGQPSPSSNASAGNSSDTSSLSRRGGQQLVIDATRRIESHVTVKSHLRVRTNLMGQPLVGSGEYAQLRSSQGLLLRLELAIQAGGQATSIKQVCDGRHLWVHRQIGDTESLSHVDLLRVERTLSTSDRPVPMAEATVILATGGLPKLLSQLSQHFDFDSTPLRAGNLSQVPVWVATGVWKPAQLGSLIPQAVEGDRVVLSKLPGHLPHQVELHLGQSDLFPYKVSYLRWDAKEGRQQLTPVVSAEFFEVTLGEELDPRQFDYRPANVSVSDHTDLFLRNLGIAVRPNTKKTR